MSEYIANCKKVFDGLVMSCWFGAKQDVAWVKNRCVVKGCKPIGPSLVEWVTELTNNTQNETYAQWILNEIRDEQATFAAKNNTQKKGPEQNATCNGNGITVGDWGECECDIGSGYYGP